MDFLWILTIKLRDLLKYSKRVFINFIWHFLRKHLYNNFTNKIITRYMNIFIHSQKFPLNAKRLSFKYHF